MSKYWRYFVSNGRGGLGCQRLGFNGHDVPLFPSVARRLHLSQGAGLEIWEVTPNRPANRAGFREDDILLAVADQPTPTMRRLLEVLRPFPAGEPLPVVLLRDEDLLMRSLVLDT